MFRIASRQSRRHYHKKPRPNQRSLRLEYLEPRLALSGGDAIQLTGEVPDAPDWLIEPYAMTDKSTCMTVVQVEGLQYYFHNVTLDTNSGWIDQTKNQENNPYFYYDGYVTYVDTVDISEGLTADTTYIYEVKARYGSEGDGGDYSVQKSVTTMTVKVAQVQHLANQIRAIETFSNPENPGRITAQLTLEGYPNPGEPNDYGSNCEKSGTRGLGAYPGDGRNTPGAFQVDLSNVGNYDADRTMFKPFGVWEGTWGTQKNVTPNDTKIAFSQTTLSEFFGIEVSNKGLIESIGAPAASVFLHDDALAKLSADEWNSTSNALIGLHIDNFQTEQLSLYLASRDATDSTTGVTDTRTITPEVMQLAKPIQYQTSKSFMWANYINFLTNSQYSSTFGKAVGLYGCTLEITSSQKVNIFGINEGEVFWCRLTPAFVLAGTYVTGEQTMMGLLGALVQADETGTGVWKVDPDKSETWITFKKERDSEDPTERIFSVDKTPLNVGEEYPSIFHYAAVVSPFGLVDYTNPSNLEMITIDQSEECMAAWGIKDRCVAGNLGYTRLGEATTVTGSQTLETGGNYIYKGLENGGTLTLVGDGTFVINAPITGPVITTSGYPNMANHGQYVWGNGQETTPWVGLEIDVSDFFTEGLLETDEDLLNSSFYVWWGSNVAAVRDAAAVATIPDYAAVRLCIMPQAKDIADPTAAAQAVSSAIYTSVWQKGDPWYQSAGVMANNVKVYGHTSNVSEWATRFIKTAPVHGTGKIDASAASGTVLIVANNTVNTVKLGSGHTTVLTSGNITGRMTYVLNSDLEKSKPTITLKANDIIDSSNITKGREWAADFATTYNNQISTTEKSKSPPYFLYSYYAGWTGPQESQTDATFQAIVRANTNTGTNDPEKIVENALSPLTVTINVDPEQAIQTSASLLTYSVKFSEATTEFDETDVTLTGTAETITGADVVVTGSGTEYTVTIKLENMASTGSVTATIAEGVVHDENGFTNLASTTTTTNSVLYVPNMISGYGKSNPAHLLGGGEPLPGVLVTLTSSTPGFGVRVTTTDDNGYYEFENVPDGNYEVTITCPDACVDTGSDTATVSAQGSHAYETDFSVGALKPSCIPNRMMAVSSLPVDSVQWRNVVKEALSLGEDTTSQIIQASVGVANQAPVAQYLVLATESEELESSDTTSANDHAVEIVDAAQPQTEEEPEEIVALAEETMPLAVASVEVSSEMVPVEEEVAPVVESVVESVDAQADVPTEEAVAQTVVAPVKVTSDETVDVENVVEVVDTTHAQPEPLPEVTTQTSVASVEVSSEVVPVEKEVAPVVESVDVQADVPTEEAVVQTVVTPVEVSSEVIVANENVAEIVDAVQGPLATEPQLITQETVVPMVEEAIARWAMVGLDQALLNKMQNTTFLVDDLDGLSLGMAIDNTVWLDDDAAGQGWFVDSTPADNREFSSAFNSGQLRAIDPEALDKVDLLTVIAHELGHVAGLEDSDIGGLMAPSLKKSTRLIPSAHDAVLASL